MSHRSAESLTPERQIERSCESDVYPPSTYVTLIPVLGLSQFPESVTSYVAGMSHPYPLVPMLAAPLILNQRIPALSVPLT
jgi:hypothetical protein